MRNRPGKYVCSHCASDNIQADAYAVWSIADQSWDLLDTYDKGAYCSDCDGETRLEWVPLTSLEDCATYAIAQDERK